MSGFGEHFDDEHIGQTALIGTAATVGLFAAYRLGQALYHSELPGRALKKFGKLIGNQSLVERGRRMQYGHLTPEQLFVQHPSAFLRQYTVRGQFLQGSENPLGNPEEEFFTEPASPQRDFHLVVAPGHGVRGGRGTTTAERIVGDDGRTRVRQGDFNLVQDSHLETVRGYGATRVSPAFKGGFLPMLQASTAAKFDSAPGPENIMAFHEGVLGIGQLNRPSHPVFTTELTGCSVVRIGSHLAHVRPHPDSEGRALHDNFTRAQSYGRRDYPEADNAFAMIRKKPDGRTKLYFQTHTYGEPSVSGSRYLK